MRKLKKTLAVLLTAAILLSFTSCNIFSSGNKRPEGYTGGFLISPLIRSDLEIYWFETRKKYEVYKVAWMRKWIYLCEFI